MGVPTTSMLGDSWTQNEDRTNHSRWHHLGGSIYPKAVPQTWDFQLQEPINPTHPHFVVVVVVGDWFSDTYNWKTPNYKNKELKKYRKKCICYLYIGIIPSEICSMHIKNRFNNFTFSWSLSYPYLRVIKYFHGQTILCLQRIPLYEGLKVGYFGWDIYYIHIHIHIHI